MGDPFVDVPQNMGEPYLGEVVVGDGMMSVAGIGPHNRSRLATPFLLGVSDPLGCEFVLGGALLDIEIILDHECLLNSLGCIGLLQHVWLPTTGLTGSSFQLFHCGGLCILILPVEFLQMSNSSDSCLGSAHRSTPPPFDAAHSPPTEMFMSVLTTGKAEV